MNWEAMLMCGAKRATGNTTTNQPINPHKPGSNAWLDGWAAVLDVINSHSQVDLQCRPSENAFLAGLSLCTPSGRSASAFMAGLSRTPSNHLPQNALLCATHHMQLS